MIFTLRFIVKNPKAYLFSESMIINSTSSFKIKTDGKTIILIYNIQTFRRCVSENAIVKNANVKNVIVKTLTLKTPL